MRIPCTVGILTYNRAAELERALESVGSFAEIIVADGGSTDGTLEVVRRHGCTIISQSDPGHPIEDFARERNRLIDAATYDWFFWLDSDELISPELRAEIAEVTTLASPPHLAYEVRMVRMSPDAAVAYRDLKDSYQVRLFNRRTGARFVRKMHERLDLDRAHFSIGRLTGAWCVPLSHPDFEEYRRTVDHRVGIMVSDNPPRTLGAYLRRGVWQPAKSMAKTALRALLVRLRHPFSPVVPLSYERNRLYSQLVVIRACARQYFGTG